MATTAEVEEYSAATNAIVVLATSQLARFMATAPGPDQVSNYYTELIRSAGRAAASTAADFYDDMRAQSRARRGFRATVAEPIPVEQARAVVRWATEPRARLWTPPESDAELWTPDDADEDDIVTDASDDSRPESDRTSSQVDPDFFEDVPESEDADDVEGDTPELEEPTPDEILSRLTRSSQRLIMQPARDTIVESVERDPADARWARVPTGEVTCAFCLVMASRGAVYTSRAAAVSVIGRRGRTRGKRALGESYHDACDCQAIPVWDEDEDYPEHYDPEALYDIYSDARDAAHSPDLKKILAKLREQQGLR
ncbi:hypothetical protein SAMN04244553_3597 [Nocardia amikacinitolerans]|uniref:Capsid maturation protease n=1 Tax=Nocardia amikacinitolerans TaxID=756689 RepID=A0A285LKB5_9NOCA|nr:hypothetical protein [Nocardia amikacinitolerans]SNY84116.1 hypothetical protein SAMN04244553_3597 [Nocardia amikacinitolerans]